MRLESKANIANIANINIQSIKEPELRFRSVGQGDLNVCFNKAGCKRYVQRQRGNKAICTDLHVSNTAYLTFYKPIKGVGRQVDILQPCPNKIYRQPNGRPHGHRPLLTVKVRTPNNTNIKANRRTQTVN
jgi:hypothetical protein